MIRPFRPRPGLYRHGEPVALRPDGAIEHCNRQVRRFLGYVDAPSRSILVPRMSRAEGKFGSPLVPVKILGFAAEVLKVAGA